MSESGGKEDTNGSSNDQTGPTKPNAGHDTASPPEPGTLKKLWAKSGITLPFILLSAKGALPPIICLAAYQSNAWAKKYTTLGYLSAIMSMLSLAMQPRAKFLQNIIISILFTCLGAAFTLLQIQCIVTARLHTTPPITPQELAALKTGASSVKSAPYNAAASTTAGAFLFFTLYVANTARAARPQLQLQIIQYAIFTVVASTNAQTFPNMTVGKAFVKRLLEVFLTGFGIGTGVSLFLLPTTSRGVIAKQFGGLFGLMKATINAHGAYMQSISNEHHDRLGDRSNVASAKPTLDDKHLAAAQNKMSTEAETFKGLVHKMQELFGKINIESEFAKREVAYGHLHGHDFSTLIELTRDVLLPIFGLSTFLDIMNTSKNIKTERRMLVEDQETLEAIRRLESDEWDEVISLSRPAFVQVQTALLGGITHVAQVLKIQKALKTKVMDVEEANSPPKPGDSAFASHLQKSTDDFHSDRLKVIKAWAERKGLSLPQTFWDQPNQHFSMKKIREGTEQGVRERMNQQQLYLILYLGYLVWSMSNSLQILVQWADSKVNDGTMKKKRLIVPAWKKLRKFFTHMFEKVDSADVAYDSEQAGASVYFGDAFTKRRDPEHLPPVTRYERATDKVRAIPRFFASDVSAFGFRAAVATMSLAILAYFKQTHSFFINSRALWAVIMIAISMSAHAGQGIFGFLGKILGTTVALCASLALWYIADQKTAAMLPLLYIYLIGGFLFLLTHPQMVLIAIISCVTVILVIGYELQERKIGLKIATSNGQPFFRIYILAPYRLAAVITGIAANFFWTFFPYPITTHSTLRNDLGATLYLLGNFYSCVHTTVELRLRLGTPDNSEDASAPMVKLDKARQKVFMKCLTMLGRLREHLNFQKFEPTFGGKFPRQSYIELIDSMQHAFNYMTLISYSSRTFATDPNAEESGWLKDFRKFAADLNLTSHQITSVFCLVSASMRNKQPLPPYLTIPTSYDLANRMENIDPELLSLQHLNEPCYAAFAVLEVAGNLITEEMRIIVKKVQDLVGEVDFSFHVISTGGSSETSTLFEKDKVALKKE